MTHAHAHARHLLAAALMALAPALAAGSGRIHGTVQTTDGRVLTGNLRWDRNENFWDDTLDAAKEEEFVSVGNNDNSFRFLGLKLPSFGGGETRIRHQLSIPFGHLRAVEPLERGWAKLEIKGGRTLKVRTGTTDLGPSMRELVVTKPGAEPITLKWPDLRRVGFSADAEGEGDRERLYGTVRTEAGDFTGFVVWDRDEALLGDVLDGDAQGRDYAIPFRDIRFIVRSGHDASRVGLTDDRELVLAGTNDVNEENRGILITLTGVGTVAVSWDEFKRLDLSPAPPSPAYDSFDGGYRLHGTITGADGSKQTGVITWDRDEQFSWEPLDGRLGELQYAIPFAHVAAIENSNRHGAVVHLRDGRILELRDSNDVNEDNKGIVVGDPHRPTAEFDWDSFQRVEFAAP